MNGVSIYGGIPPLPRSKWIVNDKRESGFYWTYAYEGWFVSEYKDKRWFVPGSESEVDDTEFERIDEQRLSHWTEKPTGIIVYKEVGLEAYEIIVSTCLCHIDENNKETYLVGNQWFRLKIKQP
jgi:hypothetical protein